MWVRTAPFHARLDPFLDCRWASHALLGLRRVRAYGEPLKPFWGHPWRTSTNGSLIRQSGRSIHRRRQVREPPLRPPRRAADVDPVTVLPHGYVRRPEQAPG